ncbi:unnamed protein product (macronuclear) [Paramecium tetraurelia]|uniref:VPS9 domain-containing protein n=1 Tax=Paramecium tetraurelia TaxID=5888 RepID=A0DKH4_PARTE|nr:uncharacterized protein GSPATT00017871001 [Paramecium tetraurelia]CAK83541.1 unnamed protein product [Paramecium tetraurelia]|eukprot:XP_001450938.1 hypothetical protein (macronuclear) [Paramecium tetraurelia strain d4-2]
MQTQSGQMDEQSQKEKQRILDKEQRKNNMKNYFHQEKELQEGLKEFQAGSLRQFYGDDSSQVQQTSQQAPVQLFGRSGFYNEIQKKNKETEKLLSRLVKKMGDAHLKVEELFFTQFIPTFVNEYQDHLINVNRMMKEHFQQKIVEIDIFFANKPFDINSNKHEKSINLKSIAIEDVLYFKNQIKSKSREPIKAPTDVDKFARDKAEFIKECDLLELYNNILDLTLLNRKITVDKKYLLLKLLTFTESRGKPQYQTDGLMMKVSSDYEILFTVFINTIMKCVNYENQKFSKFNANDGSESTLKTISVSIISLDSFDLKEQKIEQQSRNFVISQKLEQMDQEPQFHFYSDHIVRMLRKHKDLESKKLNEFILYTSRDNNSLNGFVCYYLLHLLCLPKQQWQQLQQIEMEQRMIKCLIRMAKDLQFLVTNL